MARLTLTRQLAFASGQDAGNMNMRKQGRSIWNEEDFNIAAETTNKLLSHLPVEEGGLPQEKLSD